MIFISYLILTSLSSTDGRNPSFLNKRSFLSIRGGDLGPVKSDSLGQIFTILPSLDAVTGTFAPISSVSKMGIEIDKGSMDEVLVQAVGAHAAGVAVTNYLATTGKTSINEAIGYGLLARIILMIKIALTHSELVKTFNLFPTVLVLGVSSTITYGLISGNLDASLCGKVVASLLALGGVTCFTSPDFIAKKIMNIDLTEKGDNTRWFFKSVAMYAIAGSLQIGLYLNSIKPEQSVGYLSLYFIPFVLLIPDVLGIESYAGMSVSKWSVLMAGVLSAFVYGTLA